MSAPDGMEGCHVAGGGEVGEKREKGREKGGMEELEEGWR